MHKYTDTPRAVILNFPRRRGRPRTRRFDKDSGTPELVMKRLKGETAEALDLCLERGIISNEQHWCGIHFRWLFTLRHGAPSVRAIDPSHFGGIETKLDDPEWRASREQEFHEAIRHLKKSGHANLLLNLCVYNERPKFLNRNTSISSHVPTTAHHINHIKDALDALSRHWKRSREQK